MYTRVSENEFIEAFKTWQGGQYRNNFSYYGLKALYEYFEEYEDSTGEKIRLDVIAICCKYSEYESLDEFNDLFDYKCNEGLEWTLETLKDHTQVIEFEKLIPAKGFGNNTKIDSFIILDF